MHSRKGIVRSPSRGIDRYSIISILAFAYAAIFGPLLLANCGLNDPACSMAPRMETRIFWPLLTLVTLGFAVQTSRVFAFLLT